MQFEGLNLHQVPDLLYQNGIALYNVRRISYVCLRVRLSLADAQKAIKLLEHTPLQITVLGERGLPVQARIVKTRPALIAGLLLGLIAVMLFATRLWAVDIHGCAQIPPSAIEAQLREYGYRPGMPRGQADMRLWQRQLMLDFPLLQWVGLTTKGVMLNVKAIENPPPPGMEPSQPGDIVALMDGVVRQITVKRGVAAVAVGDSVRAGQVLIRGVIQWGSADGENFGEAPTAAQGTVLGTIYREGYAEASALVPSATHTGRTATAEYMVIGGWRRMLSGEAPFTLAETETDWRPFGGAFTLFPAGIEKTVYKEYEFIKQPADLQVLEAALAARAETELLPYIPQTARVIDKKHICDIIEATEDSDPKLAVVLWIEAECELGGRPFPDIP
ncbi:MAG: sporulation protein YqfD [Clostridia bacterium]|nr:sporulation protein YqfD [Clostridia bacterium]